MKLDESIESTDEVMPPISKHRMLARKPRPKAHLNDRMNERLNDLLVERLIERLIERVIVQWSGRMKPQ